MLSENIFGFAVEGLICLDKRLGPFGMVDGIGIELCFQADAASVAVGNTVLADFTHEEITAVELNTGAVRGYCHSASGFRVGQNGTGVGKNFKIVVVAALQLQGFIICVDISADGFGNPEVHGSADDSSVFTGGNGHGICYGEEPSRNGQDLGHGLFRMVVTGQIEIAVIGKVEHRILIADGIVADTQRA